MNLQRMGTRALAMGLRLAALLAIAAPVQAQTTGRVLGRVYDAQTGEGIANVSIEITGTSLGALSGVDGRYMIPNVPAGIVTISARSIGYADKTVTELRVNPGVATEQNLTMTTAAVEMAAISVTAAAERGSVTRALDQQRTATGIVNAITAEQISRSPDGDAAAAMQRVSGVTVQDGKYIHVRGLGERYTTTSLNGARIPSPEPERKVVPLDMFPSGLLQTITTSKTFTPDQSGDFSGAQVDIRTREFPGERQFTFSTGFGFNSRVTGSTMMAAPRTGSEWFGSAGSERAIPASVLAAGDFTQQVRQAEMNRMVNSFRNAWTPRQGTGRGSSSLGASLGGTDAVFGQRVSYLASATYSYGEEVRAGEVRARALPAEGGAVVESDRFAGATGRTSILYGGLANFSTLIGQNTRLFLNSTLNRTADNEARQEIGTSENYGGMPLQVQRLRFVQRDVNSLQLGAEHALGRHSLDWSATRSGVRRYEPDRSEFVYAQTEAGQPFRWFSASNEGAVRTFSELNENIMEAAANYTMKFGSAGANRVKTGVLGRLTKRDAESTAYSISATQLPASALTLTPEQIFDGRFTADGHGYLRVSPLGQGGSYDVEDRLVAGYLLADFGLTESLRVIGGARVERSDVELSARATVGSDLYPSTPRYTDVLPSLALNYSLGETQNIRLSASQTLSRPEYRELANVQYRDVIGGENVVGNPELQRTLVQNYDARWEWYPSLGEVVSVAAFMKKFDAPIERVYRATSGTSVVTFVNAQSADNLGVELELRKRLGFVGESWDALTVFSNVTVMRSEITIPESSSSQTNTNRPMVGQAPYVANAGVTWAPDWRGFNATVLYNVVGERVISAGEVPLPDVREAARHMVDVSLRSALTDAISVKLDAKNLLDTEHRLTQGDVLRESYRSGRAISLGLSWRR